jgi:hypothetical protein
MAGLLVFNEAGHIHTHTHTHAHAHTHTHSLQVPTTTSMGRGGRPSAVARMSTGGRAPRRVRPRRVKGKAKQWTRSKSGVTTRSSGSNKHISMPEVKAAVVVKMQPEVKAAVVVKMEPEVKAEVVDKMKPGDGHTDEDCTDGHIDGVEGDVASAHSCGDCPLCSCLPLPPPLRRCSLEASAHSCGDCPHCSCLPLPPPLRRCNLEDNTPAGWHYVVLGDAAEYEELHGPPCLPLRDNCADWPSNKQ